MKTKTISKRRVWKQCGAELEVWECLPMIDKDKTDATPLAYVAEHVRKVGGSSFFTYEVGSQMGWEFRRKEAMRKAEDILNVKDTTRG